MNSGIVGDLYHRGDAALGGFKDWPSRSRDVRVRPIVTDCSFIPTVATGDPVEPVYLPACHNPGT
jgi:hypothetical protein